MIQNKGKIVKIKGTKSELENELTSIFITLIENDFFIEEDILNCLNCAKSLKDMYEDKPQIAPEILKMLGGE